LIGKIEFGETPQHFLHVDRVGPAPDLQLALLIIWHAFFLPMMRLSASYRKFRKKARAAWRITKMASAKKAPRQQGLICVECADHGG
jgi:hypothetical protein